MHLRDAVVRRRSLSWRNIFQNWKLDHFLRIPDKGNHLRAATLSQRSQFENAFRAAEQCLFM